MPLNTLQGLSKISCVARAVSFPIHRVSFPSSKMRGLSQVGKGPREKRARERKLGIPGEAGAPGPW